MLARSQTPDQKRSINGSAGTPREYAQGYARIASGTIDADDADRWRCIRDGEIGRTEFERLFPGVEVANTGGVSEGRYQAALDWAKAQKTLIVATGTTWREQIRLKCPTVKQYAVAIADACDARDRENGRRAGALHTIDELRATIADQDAEIADLRYQLDAIRAALFAEVAE